MKWTALKRVAMIVAGQSPPSSEVGRFEGDGLPFLQGNAEFGAMHPNPIHRCDSAPKRCLSADVLLSVRAPVGALNVADKAYGIGRGLCAVRPRPEMDGGFLWWALNGVRRELDRNSVGSTYTAVTAEDVGALAIPSVTLTAQRAIADFLDVETARIDALVGKKRRLYALLQERFASYVEHVVWRDIGNTLPLMRLTPSDRQIMYGIVLPGPDVADGVPIVKGGNVASGRLGPGDLARTTREIEAHYARARLAAGDVIYAIRGGIGDVAIVPSTIADANITQDVARVAPRSGVDPRWIRYALESPTARGDALARVVGATVKGINIRDLKRVRVPEIDQAEMRNRADEIEQTERSIEAARELLVRQTRLLTEHRQALITAAVTGQLEIPGVAA